VTRGRLQQRAGLPGLNGSGAAAAVPLWTNNGKRPTKLWTEAAFDAQTL